MVGHSARTRSTRRVSCLSTVSSLCFKQGKIASRRFVISRQEGKRMCGCERDAYHKNPFAKHLYLGKIQNSRSILSFSCRTNGPVTSVFISYFTFTLSLSLYLNCKLNCKYQLCLNEWTIQAKFSSSLSRVVQVGNSVTLRYK